MIYVISKKEFGEQKVRSIETNSTWTKNPYGEDYAIVPEELVENILKTKGFCDIELNKEGTEVIFFTPKEIPEMPEPERLPTAEERIAALETAMLEMLGVTTDD